MKIHQNLLHLKRGIFIRDTAYSIVIQWSIRSDFIESHWNMPYPVWKYPTKGLCNHCRRHTALLFFFSKSIIFQNLNIPKITVQMLCAYKYNYFMTFTTVYQNLHIIVIMLQATGFCSCSSTENANYLGFLQEIRVLHERVMSLRLTRYA